MTTHNFDFLANGFNPGTVDAKGGDSVKIKNLLESSIDLDFPDCFEVTASHTLESYAEVTRALKSGAPLGSYSLTAGPSDPASFGEEFPQGSSGTIIIIAN